MSADAAGTPPVRIVGLNALDRRYQALRLPGTPEQRAALRASLERHGQQRPALASDGIEPGVLVLLDGYKRAEELAALGVNEVLVSVVTLDAPGSLVALLVANAGQRGSSELEEAWVVAALQTEHGLTQVEIGELLGRHKTWVCRRLQLVTRLERSVQDDIRLGLVSVSVARQLARLPRGNQGAASQAAARHGLTSHEVGRLVGALLAADPPQRREILKNPLAHLPPPAPQSDLKPAPDARLSGPANRVRHQLLRLCGAVNRLRELFLEHPPTGFSERDTQVLAGLAAPIHARAIEALQHVQVLLRACDEEQPNAS